MKHLKTFNVILLAPVIGLLLSCATAQPSAQSSSQALSYNIAYTPSKQTVKIPLDQAKSNIAELLKKAEILDGKKGDLNVSSTDITVTDDKIEIKAKGQTTVVNFSDLVNFPINVNRQYYPNVKVKPTSNGTYVLYAKVNGKLTQVVYKPFQIQCKNLISFNYGAYNYEDAQKLADNLFVVQSLASKKMAAARLNQFDAIASQYRALKVKPPVSEEQRKFIVQANAFNQDKNYLKAIELYTKAIELDQTAFPSAYLNLALLSAQVSKYDQAIFNMKKYLLLEPESKDARSAQDKIYEWEIKLEK